MSDVATRKANIFMRATTPVLAESLRTLEAKAGANRAGLSPHERTARANIIDELERRFPQAGEAVSLAFEEAEERDPMDPGYQVDYAGVLLAHIPAEEMRAS